MAADDMPSSTPPQINPVRGSSIPKRPQYTTPHPGLTICARTSSASVSALCCTRLPVMVIGDVAPPVGAGRLAQITPAFAISTIAAAAGSWIVNGLTGERESVSSLAGVPITCAISTAYFTSSAN